MELNGELPSSYLIGINQVRISIAEFGVEADSIPVQCSKDEAKSHAYLSSADRQRSDSFKKRRPTLLRALTRQQSFAFLTSIFSIIRECPFLLVPFLL